MLTTLFSLSLLSAITLTLLFGVWWKTMRGGGFHSLNRGTLWFIVAASVIVPFLPAIGPDVTYATESADISVSAARVSDVASAVNDPEVIGRGKALMPMVLRVLSILYGIGIAAILVIGAIGVCRLISLIRAGQRIISPQGIPVILTESRMVAPFSFIGMIVMSRDDYERDGEMILCHELAHIAGHHWVDLVAVRLLCIMQWFNPAAWLLAREMSTIHEYEADSHVLQSGIDPYMYQMLLVTHAAGMRLSPLTNSLNNSKLKARISMMNLPEDGTLKRMRVLALIPAVATAIFLINIPVVASTLRVDLRALSESPMEGVSVLGYADKETAMPDEDENEPVFNVVEDKPQFPGGEEMLLRFIGTNLRYPQEAYDQGIEGRVIVQFVIRKNGSVGRVRVVRGEHSLLDEEAMRVVRTLPDFIPGKVNGQPVAVWYTLPIRFKIPESDGMAHVEKRVVLDGSDKGPAVFVDGRKSDRIVDIDPESIRSIHVIKDNPDYPNGLVYIRLKS
ncbi:MAG: M56 family metallopeptidase [Muribaculaceae bacterium]|nr:M56 family metallopeptidase [Muribaculaceae bacterium]